MLGTETVVLGADLVRDEDGKAVAPVGVLTGPVEGCHVEPMTSAELVQLGRESTEDVVRVFLPIVDGITEATVLTVRGRSGYRIDGNPIPYISDEDPELSGYNVKATRRAG